MTATPTPAQQKRRANMQLAGLSLYIIFCGAAAAITVFFVVMAQKYGCSVTEAVLGSSICNIVAFITGQFAGGVIKKFGARTSMIISLVGVAVGFLIMAVAPNIYVAWLGFAFCGLMYSFGLTMPSGAMIRTWWYDKQGTVMGTVFGLAGIGTAFWPILAGVMIQAFGLSTMLFIYVPLFFVPALLVVIFMLKDRPEDCGMKPIGWTEEKAAAAAATMPARPAASSKPSASVYLMPVFWVCAVALLIQVVTQSGASLLPTALQANGMDVALASVVASVSSIIAIFGNMFTGWLRDKVGFTGFTVFNFGMFILFGISFIVWMQSDSMAFLVLMIVGQALCRAMLYMPAHMSGLLFPDNADVAQARMQSIVSLGGVLILPMVSAFAESAGSYLPVAYLWIAAAVVSGAVWIVLIKKKTPRRQDARQIQDCVVQTEGE